MRLANKEELEELALKQQQEQINLTEEELEYLYNNALEEIATINKNTELYKNMISQSFLGANFFSDDSTNVFFSSMDELLNIFLPAILTGEYDKIGEYGLTTDECNDLRIHTYNNLRKIYLKEE